MFAGREKPLPPNRLSSAKVEGYIGHRNPKNYLVRKIQEDRNKWLEVIKKYPEASRRQLMNKANTLYLWLKKHDLEWFESHLPEPKKISIKKERLNWKKLDEELSIKIKEVCLEIRESAVKPIRVSITEIITRSGCKSWLEKREKKLPLTSKVVDNALETPGRLYDSEANVSRR